MPRPTKLRRDMLEALIRSRGPVSATELADLVGVNRTTLVRTLADLGPDLATFGATRSTRYLMRRDIRHLGNHWPMYRVDASGQPREWARLEAFHDRAWRIAWAGSAPDWAGHFSKDQHLWNGFPFFLTDMRPQGFLGNLLASKFAPILRLPADTRLWSDDEVLIFLDTLGTDLPGDLILGENSLKQALEQQANPSWVSHDAAGPTYAEIATTLANQPPGSSVSGEQPKFCTNLRSSNGNLHAVLVKFTAPMNLETGRRWADLLTCEFHAHEVLAEAGLSNPGARLLDSNNRRFLEIPRFDRTQKYGRRGVVSLEALAAASIGLHHDWHGAAIALRKIGLIHDTVVETITLLQNFGVLIGNNEMHAGNLAFYLTDSLPLQTAPAYDMLPMLWAPGPQGEIPERTFSPSRPLPSLAGSWDRAASLAKTFWQRVANDGRVSRDFAKIASRAQEALSRIT